MATVMIPLAAGAAPVPPVGAGAGGGGVGYPPLLPCGPQPLGYSINHGSVMRNSTSSADSIKAWYTEQAVVQVNPTEKCAA
eukprot:scaffold161827_cov43-Attheya_sp.AAC.1